MNDRKRSGKGSFSCFCELWTHETRSNYDIWKDWVHAGLLSYLHFLFSLS